MTETIGRQKCPACDHWHYYGMDIYGSCRVCDCDRKGDLSHPPSVCGGHQFC